MLIFDSLICILILMLIVRFFKHHPYINGVLTLSIITIMTTSFWMPLRWFDDNTTEPFLGKYEFNRNDTTIIYYATYNAESIIKRNDYIYNNRNKKIKCINMDKYKSLFIEDAKFYNLDSFENVSYERDSLTTNFNWNYTIFEYNDNVLINCY